MYLCVETNYAGGKPKATRFVLVLDYGEKVPDDAEEVRSMLYDAAIHLPSVDKLKVVKLKK